MHKGLVLVLVATLAPHVATAHVVRHNSIPEPYWGAWTPGDGECSAGDKSAIVLAAKTYTGPSGSCAVDYVSETPSPKGALFSARLLCPSPGAQAKKTVVNLLFRSDGADRVSFGPEFADLKAHRRCAATAPAAKQ
jgi:hypothetical protein